MSDQVHKSLLAAENARIQFVHESPLITDISEDKAKVAPTNYELSTDEETWFENEAAKKKLKPGKKTRGRVKIKMEFIKDKVRRFTTFSKRKTGLMKKAYELAQLTGAQLMLLVASETGHVYTFATEKLKPIIDRTEGQDLIEACLNNDMQTRVTNKRSSETSSKSNLSKKSMLRTPSPSVQNTTTTMVNTSVLNMVVNEVHPGDVVKKIVVPIDLSQHLHYHFQQASHGAEPNNNNNNNNSTSNNNNNKKGYANNSINNNNNNNSGNNFNNDNTNHDVSNTILPKSNHKQKGKNPQCNNINSLQLKSDHPLNNNNNNNTLNEKNNNAYNNITSAHNNINNNNIDNVSYNISNEKSLELLRSLQNELDKSNLGNNKHLFDTNLLVTHGNDLQNNNSHFFNNNTLANNNISYTTNNNENIHFITLSNSNDLNNSNLNNANTSIAITNNTSLNNNLNTTFNNNTMNNFNTNNNDLNTNINLNTNNGNDFNHLHINNDLLNSLLMNSTFASSQVLLMNSPPSSSNFLPTDDASS